MLLINTKEKQAIKIGDNLILNLNYIDIENNKAEFTITNKDDDSRYDFAVSVGVSVQATENIIIRAHRIISTSNNTQLTIGIDAPDYIKIHADWMRKRNDAKTIRRMAMKELLEYASKNANTKLEIELLDRLKGCLNHGM